MRRWGPERVWWGYGKGVGREEEGGKARWGWETLDGSDGIVE